MVSAVTSDLPAMSATIKGIETVPNQQHTEQGDAQTHTNKRLRSSSTSSSFSLSSSTTSLLQQVSSRVSSFWSWVTSALALSPSPSIPSTDVTDITDIVPVNHPSAVAVEVDVTHAAEDKLKQEILATVTKSTAKSIVFADLHSKGYFVGPGDVYGERERERERQFEKETTFLFSSI